MMLNEILSHRKRDVEELKRRYPLHRVKDAVEHRQRTTVRNFRKAISATKGLNLICELKKASPSEGNLREDFQPLRIAGLFEYAGAAAISVLTEPHYFKGRPSYLKTIRQITSIPVLRKDFILESYQIYESALLEADAFLLIASVLTEEELTSLIKLGKDLRMDALVEVHNDEDLKKAVQSGAKIIGINNRDLKSFHVDPNRAKQLIPHVPKGIDIIVESGLKRHEELMEYKSLGVNAFLIGTTLMRSEDILGTIQNFLGGEQVLRKKRR